LHHPKSNSPSSSTAGRREGNANAQSDSSGLHVLFAPSKAPSADIIFVHGLGGSSEKTWCYDGDSDRFWPKLWLPLEPEISSARIMSFGYNADYRNTGPNSVSSISDFARDLLFNLKFGRDIEDRNDLDIGKVGSFDPNSNSFCSLVYQRPIIFVVHSMGGLVFKKVGALRVFVDQIPIINIDRARTSRAGISYQTADHVLISAD